VTRLAARTDRLWVPAAIAVVFALAFVVVRLVITLDGDASAFAMVGSQYADTARTPAGLHVEPQSDGYDGQFFYRLALDPANLHLAEAHGIRIDDALRTERIGYPVLAWIGAGGGQQSLVPWSLIAVNVVGIGAIGALGGLLARRYRRHAAWGAALAGYWGFLFTIGRDLSEIVAAVGTLAGLVLVLRRRPVAAAIVFTAAVLVREQSVLVAALVTLGAVLVERRAGRRVSKSYVLPFVVPAAALVVWNLVVAAVIGTLPATSSKNANFGVPLDGLVTAAHTWYDGVSGAVAHSRFTGALDFLQLFALVAVVAAACIGWRASRHQLEVWVPLAGLTLFALCLTDSVYGDPANFRTVYDVYLFGVIAVFAGQRRLWWLAVAVPIVWVLSTYALVRSI